MTTQHMMREASIPRLLLQMSLPVILVMLVNALYNMADVFFMGRTGETMAVAAIALCGPVFSVFSAFNTLLGFGACTAASMALGRGEYRRVRQFTSFCLYSSLLVGSLSMAAVWIAMKPMLSLLGADEVTAPYAAAYLRVFALSAPFMVSAGSLGNTLRADGDSKSALVGTMSGTVINILLDPLFISVLHRGIVGAAAATVIGNIVSFCVMLSVARKKETFSVSLRDFSLRKEISLTVLSYGLPMAAGTLLMSFSSTFANRLLVLYGNEAVAAQGVAGKAGMLIAMLVMGVCMGVQPAVSYAYGSGDRRRLRQVVLGTGLSAVIIGTVLGLAFLIFRDRFVTAFLDNDAVIIYGRRMVLGSIVSAPFYGVYQMCAVYLQGTGKVSYATFTALMQKGIVYLPVLFLLHRFFGLTGLIFAPAVTDLIATAVALALCLNWASQLRQTPAANPLPRSA